MDDEARRALPPVLTPAEVAAFLRVSKSSVYRLVEKRVLPAYKVGGSLRFSRAALLTYLEASTVPSSTSYSYDYTKTKQHVVRRFPVSVSSVSPPQPGQLSGGGSGV